MTIWSGSSRISSTRTRVRLVFFTQTFGCDTCLPARQAIDQIAGLSERITVEEALYQRPSTSVPHPEHRVYPYLLRDRAVTCTTSCSTRRSLSERITVEEHNLVLDKEKVEEYGVERAPAIAIVGESDLGIRYYGVPAGYELASIVDAVLLAGTGEIGLSDKSLAAIAGLERSVDIKVFVTPT